MTGWRLWLLGCGLVCGATAIGLVLAEVGVRTFSPQPTGLSYQDQYGLGMHVPGLTTYLPQYGHEVSFNEVGMRDREHALHREAGVYRILLLGDSFMEAIQVPFDSSFAPRLERALVQRTGKPAEVINAGVSGWGTDDELQYLTEYGLAYHPDLVLVAITLHNDISDNLRQQWHTAQNGVLVERERRPYSFFRYKVIQLKAIVASRLQLYQLWRKVRHGREIRQVGSELRSHVVELNMEPTPAHIEQGLQLTEQLLKRVKQVTAAQGGHVALVLLPLKVQLSDTAYSEFVRAAKGSLQAMPLGKPQRDLMAIAARLEIPVVDLLPAFREWTATDSTPLFLSWDGHWNAAGHRLAAEVVANGLTADAPKW